MSADSWRSQLAALDASLPWFTPYAGPLQELQRAVMQGADAASALSQCCDSQAQPGLPRFVPSQALPHGEAYESFVARNGTVPTRDNLHDLFNGLVWRQFPRAKRRLNALQAAQIAVQGANAPRGPVRDAITVFDENGAVLHAPDAIWDALLEREWRRAFVDLRPLWQEAKVLVFGHALLEKLLQPRKEITAHVLRAQCPKGRVADLDSWLAAQLTGERLAAKPFAPLPVLGIPGWWAGNQNFCFYDDSQVFRRPVGKT